MMEKAHRKSEFLQSVFLSVVGLCVYNLAIQVFVYPTLDRVLGHESYGRMLTAISVISVAAVSVGVGVNYERMALHARVESANGDYNFALLVGAVFCGGAGVLAGRFVGMTGAVSYILLALMSVSMMLRYYSDVDFRLDVNYRKLLVFYLVLSAGYIVGTLLFAKPDCWQAVFITAELLSVLFVVLFGKIYRKPLVCSENRKKVFHSSARLVASQVFANGILNCDRMLIGGLMNGTAVTVFYTASLLGKSVALLTGPFNGVIIGFLAKSNRPITRRFFMLCVGGACAVSVLMFAVLIPVTPFVIRLLYPSVADSAAPYYLWANAGQIVYFISNLLLVIALRFLSERFQLFVNLGYTVLYLALCVPCLMQGDLMRFMQCALLAGGIRFAAIVLTGFFKTKKVSV